MIHGRSPTLLNVTYIRSAPKLNISEHFEVIYRDDDGNICKSDEPPDVDIYFTKPKFRKFDNNGNPVDLWKPEERLERLDVKRVPYGRIRQTIEHEIGELGHRFYRRCMDNQTYDDLDDFYLWPYSYRADFLPEFYYMQEWMNRYPLPPSVKLTRAYLDIEVDQIDTYVNLDSIPGTANCPVNCVTVLIEESLQCYTFILEPYEPSHIGYNDDDYRLRRKRYDTQLIDHSKLMSDAGMDNFIRDLNDTFDPVYGHITYHIRSFSSELELIRDVFQVINHWKPNFCLQWNMRFDIQYLVYRLQMIGGKEIVAPTICHPDFDRQSCYFKIDRSTFQLEKQFDYFYCSSYTQYICQMRNYASIRKSQHALKSVALNYIADRELRDRKIEYANEMNFIEFMYLDWPRFVKYNIKDVLLQLGIERKCNDTMTYYLRSMVNCTPYPKIFRETYLLRNVRELYFNRDGWVQGNNVNIIMLRKKWRAEKKLKEAFNQTEESMDTLPSADDDDNVTTFKGAIMADPTMNDNVGIDVLGVPSNVVFMNTMDFDMRRFYPANKIMCNMDPITLIGKATFMGKGNPAMEEFITGERLNRSLNQIYEEKDKNKVMRRNDHTGEAVNTYLTGNILTFGYNWLGLPSVSELYKVVKGEQR